MSGSAFSFASAGFDRIQTAVDRVFESSPWRPGLTARIDQAKRHLVEIDGRRGVGTEIISVIGTKNAGKSWLCRCMVLDQDARQRIEVGDEETTEKVWWIGPESPAELQPQVECHLHMPQHQLHDLGHPYNLLDVPGLNDMDAGARESARQLTAATALRVFVTTSESHKDEDAYIYLEKSAGARILPVLVDERFASRDDAGRDRLADELRARIRKHLRGDGTEILDVVFVPKFKYAADAASASAIEQKACEIIRSALRRMLALPPVDRSGMAAAQVELLKRPLRHELREFVRHVEPAYHDLKESEREAAGQIVSQLLGKDKDMRAGIRLRLLAALPGRTPLLFFPFRGFLTLLAFTTGAIDRVILGVAGSVVSLAMTALQAARNLQKHEAMQHRALELLQQRASQLARSRVREKYELFLHKVAQQISGEERVTSGASLDSVELAGLEDLVEGSRAIFDEEIDRAARSRALLWALGGAATALFWIIGLAPIWAIYRAYFEAWFPAFAGPEKTGLSDFPAPSGEMVFTTIIVMTLPVFLLALLTISIGARKHRVEACLGRIRSRHDRLTDDLTRPTLSGAPPVFRITSHDPFREAVREILDFCQVPNSVTRDP